MRLQLGARRVGGARLVELTRNLKSVDQAIRALGRPDRIVAGGLRVRTPPKGRRPPRVQDYRVLIFTKMSDTADVELADGGPEGISFSFCGKYLGKQQRPRTRKR